MEQITDVKWKTITKPAKFSLIFLLIGVIAILHYITIGGELGLHIFHRELFFIPILLASFWFGARVGLMTSLVVSFIYASYILYSGSTHTQFFAIVFQVIVFNLVAFVLGLLIDRQKRRQKELIVTENLAVLGRAATAIAHEMKDLLNVLRFLTQKHDGENAANLNPDFFAELSRLEKMIDILNTFETTEPVQFFSHDINTDILNSIERYKKRAHKIGVSFQTDLDDKECPTQVNPDTINWIFDQIIINALDVSNNAQSIHIRSQRRGNFCTVVIEDEGPGISPENLTNIFKPFFTTKKLGQGLALAGCHKILTDIGGDIEIESEYGKGAKFIMKIPREYSGKSLAIDPISTVIKGEKVFGLYRE